MQNRRCLDPSDGNAKSNIESEVLGFRARRVYLATFLMLRLLMPCLPFPVRSQVRSAGVSSVFSLFPKSNDSPTPLHASMALSLVSVNVNGLRDSDKRLTLLQWLSHSLLRWFVCTRLMHSLRISFVCGFRGLEMNICCITNKTSINSSVEVKVCYSQLKNLAVLIHPSLSF